MNPPSLGRYFYPPGGKREFASKKQVEQYLKYTQPGINLDAFWETYRWRIPAVDGELQSCGQLGILYNQTATIIIVWSPEVYLSETARTQEQEEMVKINILQCWGWASDDVLVAHTEDHSSPVQ